MQRCCCFGHVVCTSGGSHPQGMHTETPWLFAQVLVLRLLTAGSVEEHICRAAADKRALADRCITGGFFDGKTGAQERQAYLLGLIRPTTPAADGCGSLHCSITGV